MKGNGLGGAYFVLGVIVTCLFLLTFGETISWPESSSEWAAWIQAIGSVGAIVVAIYIVNYESRENRRLKADKEMDQRKFSLKITLKCCDYALDVPNVYKNKSGVYAENSNEILQVRITTEKLKNNLSVLDKFAIAGHFSSEQTINALCVFDCCLSLLYLYNEYEKTLGYDPISFKKFNDTRKELIKLRNYFKDEISQLN